MEIVTKWNAGKTMLGTFYEMECLSKILEPLYGYGIKAKWNYATNAFHEPEQRSGAFRSISSPDYRLWLMVDYIKDPLLLCQTNESSVIKVICPKTSDLSQFLPFRMEIATVFLVTMATSVSCPAQMGNVWMNVHGD